MPCTNCFNNCGAILTSDKCVKYTGPDIEFLDIETGDSLYMLEASLIEQLENAVAGTGITFEEFAACETITEALDGADENLATIIQAISDVICTMKADITELQEDIDPPLSISGACLGLDASPTRDEVLQALATKVCSLSATVTTISGNYVTTESICELVEDCVGDSDISSQEYSRMPKYVALPYHGPLNVFDSEGKGISSAGYDKVYICNGQVVGTFVTPDYRGRSPLGVNQGLPGGTLDAAVDPALINNAGYNISQGTKKGAYTDTLSIAQMPSHSHAVTDPGHTHSEIGPGNIGDHPGGSAGFDRPNGSQTNSTGSATTGITLSATGSSTPHNSTHPVIGAVFIIYIP